MAFQSNFPVHLLLDLDKSVIDRLIQVGEAIDQYQTSRMAGDWGDLIQHAEILGGLAEVILHQISAQSVIGGLVRENLATKDKGYRQLFTLMKDGDSPEAVQMRADISNYSLLNWEIP